MEKITYEQIEKKVHQIISETSEEPLEKCKKFGLETQLDEDLGMDCGDISQLSFKLDDSFGINLDDKYIDTLYTTRAVVDIIYINILRDKSSKYNSF